VPLAGVEEVEEIAVGELRVSLPGAVRDEDADLVEIEALSVRKVALDLGSVVFEPEAGVTARADGGVERGRVVKPRTLVRSEEGFSAKAGPVIRARTRMNTRVMATPG
jgi:hypothetical protein